MFCHKCGNKLPADAAFCQKCGTKIEGVVSPQSVIVPNNATNVGSASNANALILGLHKQRLAILVSSIIGTLSMFLPWATSFLWGFSETWNAFQFAENAITGLVILLFFVIPLVASLLGDRSKQLTERGKRLCFWDGIAGVVYGIWFITHINGLPWDTQLREGLFVMMLASVAVTVCSLLLNNNAEG